MALADQAAVAAGVTVVASSGDAGPFNNIGSPATTPGVIAVGGTTTYRVYRQTTRYGTQLSPGGWENNNITALSSDGITEFNPHTVDVVAPGDRGWSLCSSNTTAFFGCADIDNGANPPPIWAAGGTSASAPETSGHRGTGHRGVPEHPRRGHAVPGAGRADHRQHGHRPRRARRPPGRRALSTRSRPSSSPSPSTATARRAARCWSNKTSLNATVNAGQTATFSVGVTNEGTGSQTVTPTVSGNPTTVSVDTGTVNLSSCVADLYRR